VLVFGAIGFMAGERETSSPSSLISIFTMPNPSLRRYFNKYSGSYNEPPATPALVQRNFH
jgi:hypothetical protein